MKVHHWPGNIRELQNVMERAVILAQDFVRCGHLPEEILCASSPDSREMMKSAEREMIIKALNKHGGSRRLTAAELGVSRRTLQYKLKKFGLVDDKREDAKLHS